MDVFELKYYGPLRNVKGELCGLGIFLVSAPESLIVFEVHDSVIPLTAFIGYTIHES